MGSILKLPCIRFVRQVSNGVSLSKYGYIGMMERNAQAIQSAAWRKAACRIDEVALTVNKVTETDGEWDAEGGKWLNRPTYSAWLQDRFDCFIQGGDAVKELGTFCGYAGMVAYRFSLPTVNPGAIDEIKLLIQRDRYLRAGVRVAVEINDNASPSTDWAIQRGENEGAIASPTSPSGGVVGVASWGFLHQYSVPYLMASRAWEGTLELNRDTFPGLEAAASSKYLWVYMSPEDFCAYWEMYNAKEQRFYSIEGSAALLSGCCTFAFETDAVAPESAEEVSGAEDAWISGTGGSNSVTATVYEGAGNFLGLHGVGGVVTPSRYAPQTVLAVMNTAANSAAILDGESLLGFDPVADVGQLGKFCAVAGVPVELTGRPFVSYLQNDGHGRDPYAQGEGGVVLAQVLSRLAMGVMAVSVPARLESYSRVRFVFPKKARFKMESGAYEERDCDFVSHGVGAVRFNLWKSSSLSLHGPFTDVALSALAAKAEFFTGGAAVVDGEIAGVGGYVEGVTVAASASLVGNFAWSEIFSGEDGDRRYFEAPVDCRVGDVLILSPQVRTLSPVPLWKAGFEEVGYCHGCCWFYGAKVAKSGAEVPGSMAVAPYAMGAVAPTVSFK